MMGISAQVSLYPLGRERLSPTINEALNIFRNHGLDVVPGSMSTVLSGDDAVVFSALQEAFQHTAQAGEVVMVTTFSNACPLPGSETEQRDIRKGEAT
jgi:uncharacterized protein YqgV (UPF0045/DUF77 family)